MWASLVWHKNSPLRASRAKMPDLKFRGGTCSAKGFDERSMVTRAGPLATIHCEPRQAWKGAAVMMDSGAEVWRVRVAT